MFLRSSLSLSAFHMNRTAVSCCSNSLNKASISTKTPSNCFIDKQYTSTRSRNVNNGEPKPFMFCPCGRRHILQTGLLSFVTKASPANGSDSDYKATLNKFHPPKPDWYEELYAYVLNSAIMQPYEEEVAAYKSQLFTHLKGIGKKVLEIGIGTGPNLKYYATNDAVEVFGADPNAKMEKYAQQAAEAAGLSATNFNFLQAVGESIPLSDASVDAVVGTLVLCSVSDVDQTLQEVKRVLKPGGLYLFVEHVAAKDGTFLRFVQNLLNPLQKTVADGCHLTRETGKKISEAGFSNVDLSTSFLSKASFVNPHVYGIATK